MSLKPAFKNIFYFVHEICLQDRCDPVMTAYKLVTIDAPYWGFGYRLEQALVAVKPLCFEQFLRY